MQNPNLKWALRLSVMMLVITVLLTSPTSVLSSRSCRCDGNPINGYCNQWGEFVPGYITNDTWMLPTPNHSSGKMVFYAPGAMEATAKYRGLSLDGYVDGVALMSPIDIGKTVWIKVDGEWHGPFLSVDCARRGDMYTVVVYRQEVIEVGFEFAEKIGMAEKLNDFGGYEAFDWYRDVEIYVARNRLETVLPDLSHSTPTHYPSWFFENLEFTTKWESSIINMQDGKWKQWGQDIFWYDEEYWNPQKDTLAGGGKSIIQMI